MTCLQNSKTKENISHMEIEGNKAADKAKVAIDIPRVTTSRQPYTDYFPANAKEMG